MNNITLILLAIIYFALNITALVISIIERKILMGTVSVIMIIAMTKIVIAEVRR